MEFSNEVIRAAQALLNEALRRLQTAPPKTLTPPAIVRLLGVDLHKVYGWIRRGELKAMDLAEKGGRPRYRIDREAFEDFKRSREALPVVRRRRHFNKN